MSLRVEKIIDRDEFLTLEAEWQELLERGQHVSFFLSHTWFRCCWDQMEMLGEPMVVVAREVLGGRMVGCAPVVSHRIRWRGLPARVVSIFQNQDSPFTGILLDRDRAEEALAALAGELFRNSGHDMIRLPSIPRWSTTHATLRAVFGNFGYLTQSGATSPVLSLSGSWQEYWESQSQRFKKTVRNNANRTQRLGRTEVVEMDARNEVSECLAIFLDVASKSWKATLPTSPAQSPNVRSFFERLTSALHAADRLAIWVLRVDGAPIATEYHVRDGDSVCALRSDFVDEYSSASPGAFLNSCIVKSYFERGLALYDMGPGDREYKMRWASAVRDGDTFVVFNHTPYSTVLQTIESRAVPALRRVRDWWRRDTEASVMAGNRKGESVARL